MQNAGHFGPGAASAHQPSQFVPSEPSPNGGSTTSSLRQFRKKDVDKSNTEQQVPKQMSESHVARGTPHNHYSPAANDLCRYPTHQFSGYNPQVKYSDIAESSQPNPISTSVIQKPKHKDYMEMCNVQQQHLNNHPQYSPENGQYMPKDPVQSYSTGFKPESQFFAKSQHQYQPLPNHSGHPKFNTMMPQNMRKYNPGPADNPFLNKLSKIHPSMARSIISDHHLQETQPTYPSMDQRGIYGQQTHRYYSGPMHPSNPYSPNSNYTMNTPHLYANYPSPSCSYPRPSPMGAVAPRYPHMERSMSPGRRGYPEGIHLNYHSMHQKMPSGHNYSPQYRGPEYSQHYQHRRMPQECFSPQSCRPAQYMPGHHQMTGQDMQEMSENTVSPSDSLKKFIENWADEEPTTEINPMESNMNLRDKLRDDVATGTVYMINASDAQYFENNGIPLVTSDNGGFQLTSENYQYLLKNGLVDNTGMVRILEANKDISIDPTGNQERIINLQIMETPKSDCMMANKSLRPSDSNLVQNDMLTKQDEDNCRVVIHQNTILNPAKGVSERNPQQQQEEHIVLHQSVVDSLSITKELVDKNCSPINLDHLEHNLDFSEPKSPETENSDVKTEINIKDSNLNEDQDSIEDLNQNSKSPSSKSMPIIDFFEPPVIGHNDDESSDSEENIKIAPESENAFAEVENVNIKSELIVEEGQNAAASQPKRKRIFSVDDIIYNIGNNAKPDSKDVGVCSNGTVKEFIENEIQFSSSEQLTIFDRSLKYFNKNISSVIEESPPEKLSESINHNNNDEEALLSTSSQRNPLKVEGTSVVLQVAGELMEITVNIVNGKKVINVTPLSDLSTVVDYNDNNYEMPSNNPNPCKEDTILSQEIIDDVKDNEILIEIQENVVNNKSEEDVATKPVNGRQEIGEQDESCPSISETHVNIALQKIEVMEEENATESLQQLSEDNGEVSAVPLNEVIENNKEDEASSFQPQQTFHRQTCSPVIADIETVLSEKGALELEASQVTEEESIEEDVSKIEDGTIVTNQCQNQVDNVVVCIQDKKTASINDYHENENNKNLTDKELVSVPTELLLENDLETVIPEVHEETEIKNISCSPTMEVIEYATLEDTETYEETLLVSDSVEEQQPENKDIHSQDKSPSESQEAVFISITENTIQTSIVTGEEAVCPIEPLDSEVAEDDEQDTESLNFPLEDEVFIEEPPAHEVVVSDPLEGIGVVEVRNNISGSPEIPLEPVTTSEGIAEESAKENNINHNIDSNATSKSEVQILSPTSTNIEDPISAAKNVYFEPRRTYSTDNDVSAYSTPIVTTKAAKKLYEVDLQVQHDIVSSSKKEETPKQESKIRKSVVKKLKRLNEKVHVKNEKKDKRKRREEFRKKESLKQTKTLKSDETKTSPQTEKTDHVEPDEEYVDFKELLRARKLKKLKRLQESKAKEINDPDNLKTDSRSLKSSSKQRLDCCIGCSTNIVRKPKPNAEENLTTKESQKLIEPKNSQSKNESYSISNGQETEKVKKQVSFSEEFPTSTSNVNAAATTTPIEMHPKDPRRKSKVFAGQVIVPSVSELIDENGGSGNKKKISLADYVNRKRKTSHTDKANEKKHKLELRTCSSPESVKNENPSKTLSDVKTAFVINSSDWEDSNSPTPTPIQLKEECIMQDFSGLINNTCKKPVIDINELTPLENSLDRKLQEYKDRVDSQLSSLNIQIPKSKHQVSKLNLGPYGSPESNSLVTRFLNNEKLSQSDMEKIRKIISYKRSMQHQKPSEPSQPPDPTYEIHNSSTRLEPREMRLHLKKVNAKRKYQSISDNEESTSGISNQNDSLNNNKKNVGYSVINRLGEDGLPKIIFKRNKKINLMKEAVVELVKLDLADLEKVKEKYNVTVTQIM